MIDGKFGERLIGEGCALHFRAAVTKPLDADHSIRLVYAGNFKVPRSKLSALDGAISS